MRPGLIAVQWCLVNQLNSDTCYDIMAIRYAKYLDKMISGYVLDCQGNYAIMPRQTETGNLGSDR